MSEREVERESETLRETDVVREYYDGTTRSRELFQEATAHMPGGNTRGVLYHSPYPQYVDDAKGPYLTDVDGNELLDFLNNYTTLIHGHDPDFIRQAAADALSGGPSPGAPTTQEIDWAAHLCGRCPAVDQIRFTNSGTEATMNAVRAARAYTGNDVIAKFEGCYHGTHDDVQVSVHPPTHLAGPESDPKSVPDSAGVPRSKMDEVIALPFNDAEAAVAKLERHRDNLAGVIIAPLMGSAVVPGEQAFIDALEEFTSGNDVPLIFDEVISFRTAHGGIHTRYDVTPDLVTYGKVIGGGFPVGAFGGRAELMAGYDPRGGADITHSGTFNANPVTAAAGLAALEAYDEAAVDHVNDLAADLADRAREIRDDHGIELRVNQYASLFNFYLTPSTVHNYRDTTRAADDLTTELYFALLSEGVRLAPKLMGCTSTAMDETHIEEFADGLDTALERIRPELEARAPQLVN